MPDFDEHQDTTTKTAEHNQQKATRIQIYTAVMDTVAVLVLTATMIGVFLYADDAKQSNILTREAIDTQTRPYLRVDIESGLTTERPEVGDHVLGVQFDVRNTGKLPAQVTAESAVFYAKDASSISVDTLRNRGSSRYFIFPDTSHAFVARGSEELSSGTIMDIRSGTGVIFVSVRLEYGHYHTSVCQMFRLVPVPQGQPSPIIAMGKSSPCGAAEDLNEAN